MLGQDEISAVDLKRADRAPLPRAADVRLPGIEGPAPPGAQRLIQARHYCLVVPVSAGELEHPTCHDARHRLPKRLAMGSRSGTTTYADAGGWAPHGQVPSDGQNVTTER